ncbi:MAG: hypothetical protein JEZ02_02265 [Desulfatibacillum sp.]|nr:hypothetical protein [Desulfatibacillum sp.]
MTIGDIPRLPDRDVRRVEELVKRVKNGETSVSHILEKALSAIGRFRIDSTGLEIKGRFKMGAEELQALFESTILRMELLPYLKGRTVYVHVKGMARNKIILGFPLGIFPATEDEIQNTDLPLVEVDLDVIPYFCQGFEGILYMSGERLLTLHRTDKIFQWIGDGWTGGLKVLDSNLPMFSLTTKKFLGQISQPLTALCDEVLTQCGV